MRQGHQVLAICLVVSLMPIEHFKRPTGIACGQPTTKSAGNDRSVEVVDLDALVGSKLRYLAQIDIADQINKGEWLVVFFHHDCTACTKSLPQLKARARKGERIAFVEIPPFARKGEEVIDPDASWALGKLSDDREWFFPMLTRVKLENGIVQQTWHGVSGKQP